MSSKPKKEKFRFVKSADGGVVPPESDDLLAHMVALAYAADHPERFAITKDCKPQSGFKPDA